MFSLIKIRNFVIPRFSTSSQALSVHCNFFSCKSFQVFLKKTNWSTSTELESRKSKLITDNTTKAQRVLLVEDNFLQRKLPLLACHDARLRLHLVLIINTRLEEINISKPNKRGFSLSWLLFPFRSENFQLDAGLEEWEKGGEVKWKAKHRKLLIVYR